MAITQRSAIFDPFSPHAFASARVNLFPQTSPFPDRLIPLMAGRAIYQTNILILCQWFDTSEFGRSELLRFQTARIRT